MQYDAQGIVLPDDADQSLVAENEYTISLDKLITGASTSAIEVVKTTTTSTVVVSLPADVQLSSTPMSGNFKIKCVYPDGSFMFTPEMPISIAMGSIEEKIRNTCKGMMYRVEVRDLGLFKSPANGMSLRLRFHGVVGDVG